MFDLNGKVPEDYGCFHVHTEIAPPEPRIEMLEIPLRDGAINTSALLSNTVHYSTREIVLGLETATVRGEWPQIQEALMRDFHGQAVQLTLEDDPNWYWEGYAVMDQLDDKGGSAGWTIRITAQPFKRAKNGQSITIGHNDTETIRIDGLRGYPTFTAYGTGITMTYNGETYTLQDEEETSFYGVFFVQGDNEVTNNSSTGYIIVKWREGTL